MDAIEPEAQVTAHHADRPIDLGDTDVHGDIAPVAEETDEGSVAKNRLKAERVLTIFSETFDE
jgi:hypothetical protein